MADIPATGRRPAKVAGPAGKVAGPGAAIATTLAAADAAAIVPEWSALADRAAEPNPFFHPDILLPALAAFGGSRSRVATVRDRTGALIGLAPVRAARLGGILPVLAVWMHDYGPLGVPLTDPAAREAAITALRGLAGRRPLLLPFLPLDGPVARTLRAAATRNGWPIAILDRHQRAMLNRPAGTAGELRSTLARRRRKEYARQLRRLGELGTVTIETAAEPAEVARRFDDFLALEAAGWKGRAGTALARQPKALAFARAAVAARAGSGGCRISTLLVDGRPAAMLVSFLAGASAYSWKIAHDETLARFSPGAQIMLEAAAALFAEPHIERIDSLADADHPMIDHLWQDRLSVGTMVVAPAGGLAFAAGLAAHHAAIGLKRAAKRLVRRRRP